MAIYHCSIKIGSRSNGRSAVVWNAVMIPEWAPKEYEDRTTLWNAVEKVEKNKNAQLFREVEVALPCELSREEQINCLSKYVYNHFVLVGMCADVAIHDKGTIAKCGSV